MAVGRNFDHSSAAQAFAGPGMDSRVWISFGRVDASTEGDGGQVVEFDEEDGQIYVNVTLLPSDMQARCRVGMIGAGSGEAVYFPLVENDEVLVALPEGDPRAGGTIVARLNNSLDPFPKTSVAGKDPATNGFGMIRTRAAMTIESGASIMLRSAAAGAFLQLDARGNITLRDGASGALQMSADVFGYQSGDNSAFLQLDLNEKRLNLKVGQASFLLAGDIGAAQAAGTPTGSFLMVPGTFTAAVGGASPPQAVEHVITTEAFCNLLDQFFIALGVAMPGPLTGAGVAGALSAVMPTAIAAAVAAPQLPTVAAALIAGFQAQSAKPPGVPGVGQQFPGLGSASFLTG